MGKAIRIEYDKIQDCIVLRRLNYKRFSFHGFGSFIWQAKPEDISVHPLALEALQKRVGKDSSLGDLAGASFDYNDTAADKNQRGFIVNYGYTGPTLEVPMEDVVIDMKTFEMFKKCVEKSEPPVSKEETDDLNAWKSLMEAEKSGDEEMIELITKKFYSREEIP
mgnify:CR=1 FL=1